MDRELITAILNLEPGETAALVTIIHTVGSTPRKAGSKMLVWPDGRMLGTIGGGCVEGEVRREALHVIQDGRPRLYAATLAADIAAGEGMVCGGVMRMFIEPVSG